MGKINCVGSRKRQNYAASLSAFTDFTRNRRNSVQAHEALVDRKRKKDWIRNLIKKAHLNFDAR